MAVGNGLSTGFAQLAGWKARPPLAAGTVTEMRAAGAGGQGTARRYVLKWRPFEEGFET